jgi:glucokinase
VLAPDDVVIVVSHSGKVPELLEVMELAQARGAKVIAVTSSQSPLARKADVVLMVDHSEDVATQMPMVSRILHLLVIDILAVGVAMRRSGADAASASILPASGKRRATPGVSAAGTLARLISHSR